MRPPTHRNALPKGFRLDEYEVDSILGHGGFGITYLAKDIKLDHWVAIKEYLPNELAVREGVSTVYAKSSTDEDAFNWGLQRFITEAQTLARFRHPSIVRVLRFFEAHGTAYMVMEYHAGQDFSSYLKQRGSLNEEELLELMLPLLDGLQKVHETGFLHRDIKPNNIFIRDDGVPVLLDFGAARYAIGQKSTSLTSIVTPGYAPFEQYDTKSAQGPWTDIYALGAVMYFVISGGKPQEAVSRLKHDRMAPAVDVGEGRYRRELLQAIDWALALDEENRPQSVSEWREALLAKPLDLLPPTKPGVVERSADQAGPRTWLLALLLLGIPGIYLLYQQLSPSPVDGPTNSVSRQMPLIAINEANVKRFIDSYFEATARADVDALLAHYAESVNYYSFGAVSQSIIRQDKLDYFERWPQVKFTLAGEPDIVPGDKENLKTVKFVTDFHVYNPNLTEDHKGVEGKAIRTWVLKTFPTQGLRIVEENEHVLKRKKLYD